MTTGKRLSRLLWFDDRVRGGHRPGSADLAARFGVSARTARRDIAYMRDRVQAPLAPRDGRRGYEYSVPGFRFPASFGRKDELVALLLAKRLFREVRTPCGEETEAVASILREIFRKSPLLEKAEAVVTFGEPGWGEGSEKVFLDLLRAVLQERTVLLQCSGPERGDGGRREVEPLRLHFHRGIWYLAGHWRAEKRTKLFPLFRIRRVEVTDRPVRRPDPFREAESCIGRAFSLPKSARIRRVRVRFDRGIAPQAAAEIWHPERKVQYELDGAAVLELPAVRYSRLLGLLLLLEGGARVLAPREAADIAEAEAERIAAQGP